MASDGSVSVTVEGTRFENAYRLTVVQATDDEVAGEVTYSSSGDVYEAEDADTSLLALRQTPTQALTTTCLRAGEFARAVDMPIGR